MRALLFDTETTGLVMNASMASDQLPEIIEFYGLMADIDTGQKISDLHRLIRPKNPLIMEYKDTKKKRKTITQITGIDNEMLEFQPPFFKVAPLILAMIEEAPVVIAQNASFDVEMVNLEAARLGRVVKWPPVLCTIEQSVHYKGYRLNLADLHEFLTGERFDGAHRARADVDAMLRCCVAMRKRGDL